MQCVEQNQHTRAESPARVGHPVSVPAGAVFFALLADAPPSRVFQGLWQWPMTAWLLHFELQSWPERRSCWLRLVMAEPSVSPCSRETRNPEPTAAVQTSLRRHLARYAISSVPDQTEAYEPSETDVKTVLRGL